MNTQYSLKKNIINTKDELLYLGQLTYVGEFYDIGKMIERPIIKKDAGENENLLY
jgi:hypothetical protein